MGLEGRRGQAPTDRRRHDLQQRHQSHPTLSADILGDWREEVLWRAEDNQSLRLYVTPHPTHLRITTLMHDPEYRLSVAWQNVAYNQPPHPSFFLGDGMKPAPRPNIKIQPDIK